MCKLVITYALAVLRVCFSDLVFGKSNSSGRLIAFCYGFCLFKAWAGPINAVARIGIVPSDLPTIMVDYQVKMANPKEKTIEPFLKIPAKPQRMWAYSEAEFSASVQGQST